MNHENSKKLVVYDVDGTMVPDTPEITGLAVKRLNEAGVFHSSDETLHAFDHLQELAWTSEHESERKAIHMMFVREYDNQMHGVPVAKFRKVVRNIIDEVVENIYQYHRDGIEQWKDEGAIVGFVSGSPNEYIQGIKQALGGDIATGSRYEKNGGLYRTDKPSSTRGRDKHLIIGSMIPRLEAIHKQPVVLEHAYGDTNNDHTMMKLARQATAVNPKADFAEVAQESGYEVVYLDRETGMPSGA